jgi:leucine-zipper of insertion element IS481
MTCRCFRISRQLYYTWLRRYHIEGPIGLRDRYRWPKTAPGATYTEAVKARRLRRRDEGEQGKLHAPTIMHLPTSGNLWVVSAGNDGQHAKQLRPTEAVSAGPHRSKWFRRQPYLVAQKILSI